MNTQWGGGGATAAGSKPTKAHLGERNRFYYNDSLKRWVVEGEEQSVIDEMNSSSAGPPIMNTSSSTNQTPAPSTTPQYNNNMYNNNTENSNGMTNGNGNTTSNGYDNSTMASVGRAKSADNFTTGMNGMGAPSIGAPGRSITSSSRNNSSLRSRYVDPLSSSSSTSSTPSSTPKNNSFNTIPAPNHLMGGGLNTLIPTANMFMPSQPISNGFSANSNGSNGNVGISTNNAAPSFFVPQQLSVSQSDTSTDERVSTTTKDASDNMVQSQFLQGTDNDSSLQSQTNDLDIGYRQQQQQHSEKQNSSSIGNTNLGGDLREEVSSNETFACNYNDAYQNYSNEQQQHQHQQQQQQQQQPTESVDHQTSNVSEYSERSLRSNSMQESNNQNDNNFNTYNVLQPINGNNYNDDSIAGAPSYYYNSTYTTSTTTTMSASGQNGSYDYYGAENNNNYIGNISETSNHDVDTVGNGEDTTSTDDNINVPPIKTHAENAVNLNYTGFESRHEYDNGGGSVDNAYDERDSLGSLNNTKIDNKTIPFTDSPYHNRSHSGSEFFRSIQSETPTPTAEVPSQMKNTTEELWTQREYATSTNYGDTDSRYPPSLNTDTISHTNAAPMNATTTTTTTMTTTTANDNNYYAQNYNYSQGYPGESSYYYQYEESTDLAENANQSYQQPMESTSMPVATHSNDVVPLTSMRAVLESATPGDFENVNETYQTTSFNRQEEEKEEDGSDASFLKTTLPRPRPATSPSTVDSTLPPPPTAQAGSSNTAGLGLGSMGMGMSMGMGGGAGGSDTYYRMSNTNGAHAGISSSNSQEQERRYRFGDSPASAYDESNYGGKGQQSNAGIIGGEMASADNDSSEDEVNPLQFAPPSTPALNEAMASTTAARVHTPTSEPPSMPSSPVVLSPNPSSIPTPMPSQMIPNSSTVVPHTLSSVSDIAASSSAAVAPPPPPPPPPTTTTTMASLHHPTQSFTNYTTPTTAAIPAPAVANGSTSASSAQDPLSPTPRKVIHRLAAAVDSEEHLQAILEMDMKLRDAQETIQSQQQDIYRQQEYIGELQQYYSTQFDAHQRQLDARLQHEMSRREELEQQLEESLNRLSFLNVATQDNNSNTSNNYNNDSKQRDEDDEDGIQEVGEGEASSSNQKGNEEGDDDEMSDLLCCLGQESKKVLILTQKLEEMGVNVDDLLDGIDDDFSLG